MSKNTYYIVQYNDRYGNGYATKMECIVKNKTDFNKWFKQHNKERKDMGATPEYKEEFDLIPITLFETK